MSVRTRMRGPVLCEQALAADPSNVRAPTWLAVKTYYSATARGSAGPGLKRADELVLTEQHCHRFVDMSRRNVSVCGRRRITTGSRAAGTVVSFKKRGVVGTSSLPRKSANLKQQLFDELRFTSTEFEEVRPR